MNQRIKKKRKNHNHYSYFLKNLEIISEKSKKIINRKKYYTYIYRYFNNNKELYYIDCSYTLRKLIKIDNYDELEGINLYLEDDMNNIGYCSLRRCGVDFIPKDIVPIILKFYKQEKIEFILPWDCCIHPLTMDFYWEENQKSQIKVWKIYLEKMITFLEKEDLENLNKKLYTWLNEYKDLYIKIKNIPEKENEVEWNEMLEAKYKKK
jgi:hypothetical protein